MTPHKNNHILLPLPLLLLVLLALPGCGVKIPGVYRIDIQQGNVVTQEQLARLRPGMDKRKVQFILGTPLIADPFNADRWDYFFSYQEGGGKRVQRRVSVFFDDQNLAHVEGDLTPETQVAAAPEASEETVVSVPNPPPPGLFGKLASLFSGNEARPTGEERPEEPAAQAPGPTTASPSE